MNTEDILLKRAIDAVRAVVSDDSVSYAATLGRLLILRDEINDRVSGVNEDIARSQEMQEMDECPTCGRMIPAGQDCLFCLAGEVEASSYAAEERAWEREVLADSYENGGEE